jgi:hypothetical protein
MSGCAATGPGADDEVGAEGTTLDLRASHDVRVAAVVGARRDLGEGVGVPSESSTEPKLVRASTELCALRTDGIAPSPLPPPFLLFIDDTGRDETGCNTGLVTEGFCEADKSSMACFSS